MKQDKLRTFLVSAAVASLVALGGAGCLVTGCGLKLDRGAWVTAAIVLTSVACAACFPRRRGGLGILCVTAVLAGYLWHQGTAGEQIRQLIFRVSHIYDSAYGWGVLHLTGRGWDQGSADFPVAILGCAAAMGTCWAMCRRKSSAWGLIPGLLPLGLCMVVTDTVPDAADLMTLLGGVTLLLLTGSVRKESAAQGSRLALRAAIPAAAFLALLALAIPKEGYVNHSQEVRETILRLVSDVPKGFQQTMDGLTGAVTAGQEKVDLSALGPQGSQKLPILEVSWDRGGTVYLRGQDYDRYTGTGWESTPDRVESFSGTGEFSGEVGIRTLAGSYGILYLPYYPGAAFPLSGGKCANTDRERVYSILRTDSSAPVTLEDDSKYLGLPSRTASRMGALLQDVLPEGSDDREKANAIADYVRGSARYDRDTARMPRGETDFALWFLEASETGYCVHFATTAAVMLRAAGIPSRYVTGYLAQCQGAGWNVVTADQAHAWVEYFDRQTGCWELLEATPADLDQEETEPAEATQPRQETENTQQESVAPPTEAPTVETEAPAAAPPADIPEQKKPDLSWLISLVEGLLAAALAAALVILQRAVRVYRRQRRSRAGSTNQRALALWREAETLGAILKEAPPEELRLTAQKAKFSQHTLEEGELEPFAAYLRRCRSRLSKAPWYLRLYYKWILAIY